VARKAGWDCHGLPVEVEVEKELGFSGKTQIEAYGIEAFNRRCRESVQRYVGDFEALTERIGMWLDVADAYWTMSDEYIESVWWHIRSMWDAGNLYEGHKVVPYCGRCGTALAATARPAGAYRDVTRLGLRPLPTGRRRCDCSSGPPRRGRSCPNVGRRSAPTSTTCGVGAGRRPRRRDGPRPRVRRPRDDACSRPVACRPGGPRHERPFEWLSSPRAPRCGRRVRHRGRRLRIVHLAPALASRPRGLRARGLPCQPGRPAAAFDASVPRRAPFVKTPTAARELLEESGRLL